MRIAGAKRALPGERERPLGNPNHSSKQTPHPKSVADLPCQMLASQDEHWIRHISQLTSFKFGVVSSRQRQHGEKEFTETLT